MVLPLPRPLQRAAHRYRTSQAYRRWMSERDAVVARELQTGALAAEVRTLDADRRTWAAPGTPERGVHVVFVPSEGPSFEDFRPGAGNIHFEIVHSLRELLGEDSVSVLDVTADTAEPQWHAALISLVRKTRATHVLFHAEADPASAGQRWSWDVPVAGLDSSWDGAFLGVMFDSAFEWTLAKGRRLATLSTRFVLVDICMPADGVLIKGRTEVGPVNMPISRETIALIDERTAKEPVSHDISFIGALYPYRVELIERLRAMGVDVAVNPHRDDQASDFASSRHNMPSYLDYMSGLHSSRMTINFSQSSAGPVQQLKTRVLESTLVGTVLLTDDRDRTERFWRLDEEYVYFSSPEELPTLVLELLEDASRVERMSEAARQRARRMAPVSFWEGVDDGLRRRGLPQVMTPVEKS